MGMRRLEFGDTLSGLLIDGIVDTPYVGASFQLTNDKGVAIEVPYLSDPGLTQFNSVQRWFSDQSPPVNMVLLTREGTVSLFDVAWSGHSENWGGRRTSVGTLRPALAVFADRHAPLPDPLVMSHLHSRLDGLNEWARLSAISTARETDDNSRVQSITMKLAHDEGLAWRQGEASMTIRAAWTHGPEHDGYDSKTVVEDNARIESTFDSGPRPFWDHFVEQRKVANLMVFLFGRPLSFREHKLRDNSFASRMDDGRILSNPMVEVISQSTYRERRAEIPSEKILGRPLAHLEQIGAIGLSTWSDNYEKWQRFILPSVTALGQTSKFLEDLVISTSMSIEAAGAILGERLGERETWSRGRSRPTTATYVYRCLDVLNVQWPQRISSRIGLSRAVANNYNDVKHYDRGDFPDHDESYVVSEINQMIVRLLAIHITGRGDELLAYYRDSGNFWQIQQALDSFGLSLDEAGEWHRDLEPSSHQDGNTDEAEK
jgi:hypothetical protein